MSFAWPADFPRVPDDSWITEPIGELATKYDTVEQHGWYANLDPTVEDLLQCIETGSVVIDYSGGTGILLDRLFAKSTEIECGFVIVDASPKFLRLSLEKYRHDSRVAFRHLRYLKGEKRLQFLDEVLSPGLVARGPCALTSTNAIHLYYDLPDTLASWYRSLRSGASVLVQSGNIDNPHAASGSWIIDDTVDKLQVHARELVRADARFAPFRAVLDAPERLAAHARLRRKYFLPVRSLDYYTDALQAAGFEVGDVKARSIEARTAEWYEFLGAYHEGVLGWAGGTLKIEGESPSQRIVKLRLELLRQSLEALLGGAPSFLANWTYIACRKP